ncbi:outer membrane protein [Francisella philomiragia]|uniref:outer membrane protein n=1 Tax=Francisella philomiragia TaxID=28110 RepID=UPI003517BAFE
MNIKIKNLFFSIVACFTINQAFATTELDKDIHIDSKKLEKDTENLYQLPPNYYNINDLDDVTKKTFKPTVYIAINGGWGQQTDMSKGGGTVVANLGYRFSESYAVEFVYQNFLVSQYNTTQVNNYFAGAAKYYYKINNYITAYAAAGLGIGHTNINGIANQRNAPSSYLATNDTWGGFAVFPVGVMFPIKYVDNLSLKVSYTYTISFTGESQNFVTSGLQYSF